MTFKNIRMPSIKFYKTRKTLIYPLLNNTVIYISLDKSMHITSLFDDYFTYQKTALPNIS